MNNFLQMSTTNRHNRMIRKLTTAMVELEEKKEVLILQEQCSIVYYGSTKQRIVNDGLVNLEEIEDMKEFKDYTIYELDYVQPDFVLFKDNKYVTDDRELRTAGQPDLIVEVWSGSNTKRDKMFLQNIYATSDITEFWQIEQNSNTVKCSIGETKLPNQSLKNILKTQKGLEFDLRYLAI